MYLMSAILALRSRNTKRLQRLEPNLVQSFKVGYIAPVQEVQLNHEGVILQISKSEANLTTWLLNQIELLEVTEGKKISGLTLAYSKDSGSVDVTLAFEEVTPSA